MRWVTVGPPNQPDTSIVLYPPDRHLGPHRRRASHHRQMMAKGTFGTLLLAAKDLDSTFERLPTGVEVVQEPTEQPYGVRDCALRDPAGNLVRIQELR